MSGRPGSPTAAEPAYGGAAPSAIVQSLHRRLPPDPIAVRPAWGYRLAVLVSLLAMFLLPAVYLLVLAVGFWLGVEHVAGHLWPLLTGRGDLAAVWFVLPAVPALAVLGLIAKPIWTRPEPEPRAEPLEAAAEPVLFAYVRRLSALAGVTPPTGIEVAMAPGASVRCPPGLRGWWGRAHILRLGLPLVAAADLQSITGVLMHELGHFAQWRRRPACRLIGAVNYWFARCVFERDAFDRFLARNAQPGRGLRRGVFVPAATLVALGRRMLFCLMRLGDATYCFMSRQAELNADQYAAAVVGSQGVRLTLETSALLQPVWDVMGEQVLAAWREGRLPDDLPRLAAGRLALLNPAQRAQTLHYVLNQTAGWADTHPSPAERIHALTDPAQPPRFVDERPAGMLFSDFAALCRHSTLAFYRSRLQEKFQPDGVVQTQQLLAEFEQSEQAQESLRRFYHGCVALTHPIFPDAEAATPCGDVAQAMGQLEQARRQMHANLPRLAEALARWARRRDKVLRLRQVECAAAVGVRVGPALSFDRPTLAQVAEAVADARQACDEEAAQLPALEAPVRERLTLALRLGQAAEVRAAIDARHAETVWSDIDRLPALCQVLTAAQPLVARLSEATAGLFAVLQHVDPQVASRRQREFIRSQAAELRRTLEEIHRQAGSVDYPFEHAGGRITLAKFLAPVLPTGDDPLPLALAGQEALERVDGLLARVLARLADACETIEAALQLPALPEPAESLEAADLRIDSPPARPRPVALVALLANVAVLTAAGLMGAVVRNTAHYGPPQWAHAPRHATYQPTLVPRSWAPPGPAGLPHQPFLPGQDLIPAYPGLQPQKQDDPTSPPGRWPGSPKAPAYGPRSPGPTPPPPGSPGYRPPSPSPAPPRTPVTPRPAPASPRPGYSPPPRGSPGAPPAPSPRR